MPLGFSDSLQGSLPSDWRSPGLSGDRQSPPTPEFLFSGLANKPRFPEEPPISGPLVSSFGSAWNVWFPLSLG